MMGNSYRLYAHLVESVQLEYWRQAIKLTRGLKKMKNIILPLRPYVWVPLTALLFGLLVGLLIGVR